MPTVSVIIPTYNHRASVLETLESVFRQTFTDYEVIVVNDGSPDDTATILKPLVESGRIRYFEQANAGQAVARNRGIAEARGEFIALLDDDDLWPEDKLAWQVESLKADTNAIMVCGYSDSFGKKTGERSPGKNSDVNETLDLIFPGNRIRSPGQTIIRKNAILALNGFDSKIWGADDWDLYFRLITLGSIIYIHRLALHYRLHLLNASRNYYRMYHNCFKLYSKHISNSAHPQIQRRRTEFRETIRVYSRLCFQSAFELAHAGHYWRARRHYIKTLWLDPRLLREKGVFRAILQVFLPRPLVWVFRRLSRSWHSTIIEKI
jgi:glycosyltransferase involved in cell wall biosynthesis